MGSVVPTVSCESAMETDDDNSDNELSTENQVRSAVVIVGLRRSRGLRGCVFVCLLVGWVIGWVVACLVACSVDWLLGCLLS